MDWSGGIFQCSPRSEDVNLMDFIFWGNLKNRVSAIPVHTRQDLIDRIAHYAIVLDIIWDCSCKCKDSDVDLESAWK